jgi:hypothetical protein
MKKTIGCGLIAMMGCTAAVVSADVDGVRHYAITITNITRGQGMAPPAVIVHNAGYRMFELGSPAVAELAPLAEMGNGAPLLSAVSGLRSVYQTALGTGGIAPGGSQTIEIATTGKFMKVSLGAMLGTTNDGFMAVRGVHLPSNGMVTVEAEAYDAGTEANSEDCAFIPGPPCGNLTHNPAASEGYVHVHAGIHVGGNGLTPAQHDWRNPVAQITIRRMD